MALPPGAATASLPLEALYLRLVRAGFPISVRDYGDLLHALRRGHGAPTRERLLWLCQALWARGDDELMRLQAVFDGLPPPPPELVREMSGIGDAAPEAPAAPAAQRPSNATAAATPAPALEFAGAETAGGSALPAARHARAPQRHPVFEPRPALAQRTLALAWRRFRLAQRAGAKTELDVEATVAEQCRSGWLTGPVFTAPRRNRARLLVLVDISASMVAWRGLAAELRESLAHGRLAHWRLLCFDNGPDTGLFTSADGRGRVPLSDALALLDGGAVLVVGDAGAARGRLDRDRVAATRDFIAALRPRCGGAAWLNPVPRARWAGSSAARIARDPWCAMHPFDDDGLVRAIDHLRGAA